MMRSVAAVSYPVCVIFPEVIWLQLKQFLLTYNSILGYVGKM